jgi:hypothetical protein
MRERFRFSTGTSTLVVFDPERLAHHADDEADWWTTDADELAEVNAGNLFAVGLGADGGYEVVLSGEPFEPSPRVREARLACRSGSVFVGAGEELALLGMKREDSRYGRYLPLPPGDYRIQALREPSGVLRLALVASNKGHRNQLTAPLRLLPEQLAAPEPAPLPAQDRPEEPTKLYPDGSVVCPACRFTFSTDDPSCWVDSRHTRCGQKLRLEPA